MREAGVPLVPGIEGVAGPDERSRQPRSSAIPVLLKAQRAAGGRACGW